MSDCGAITHSGDQQEGSNEGGYDELNTVEADKVHFDVAYLAVLVNSYNGQGFTNMETATMALMQNG